MSAKSKESPSIDALKRKILMKKIEMLKKKSREKISYKKVKSTNMRRLPKSLWLAYILREKVEVLEKLTVVPSSQSLSLSRDLLTSKTEYKTGVSSEDLAMIVLEYFYRKGYTRAFRTLLEELSQDGIKFDIVFPCGDSDTLKSLLRMGAAGFDVPSIMKSTFKNEMYQLISRTLARHGFGPNKKLITLNYAVKGKVQTDPCVVYRLKADDFFDKVTELGDRNINIWDLDKRPKPDIVYNSDKSIHLISLNRLVEEVTSEVTQNVRIAKIIIFTHHNFVSSIVLFKKLVERYLVPEPDAEEFGHNTELIATYAKKRNIIRVRVVNYIKLWIENAGYDFQNSLLGNELDEFIDGILIKQGSSRFAEKLRREFEKSNLKENANYIAKKFGYVGAKGASLDGVPEPLVSRSFFMLKEPTIYDVNPRELARQITIYEFRIFLKIRPFEFFSVYNKRINSKNINKLIDSFNRISSLVQQSIIYAGNLKDRVKKIEYWIKVVHNLYKNKNFNSLNAVISGINSNGVHRLRHTWNEVDKKSKEIFERAKDIMDPKYSYKNMRMAVIDEENEKGTFFPYLGTYLRDLTFIYDGNPTFVDGLINLSKARIVYEVVEKIISFQMAVYKFQPVYQIQKLLKRELKNIDISEERKQEMFKKSLELEPRNSRRSEIA